MTKTDNESFADFLEAMNRKRPKGTYGIDTPYGEIILNDDFVKKQNAEKNVGKILELHVAKRAIEKAMEKTGVDSKEDRAFLRECDFLLSNIEYALQDLWGFKRDVNYHRFWDRPHCSCPKLDNDDAYPTGYYVVSEECILHGGRWNLKS